MYKGVKSKLDYLPRASPTRSADFFNIQKKNVSENKKD